MHKLHCMAKLIISERENNLENILYIKESVNELISHTKSQLRIYKTGDRICLSVICSEYYKDIIQAEIIDKISEIIVIKYKYEFFKERTKVAGLNEEERELLKSEQYQKKLALALCAALLEYISAEAQPR